MKAYIVWSHVAGRWEVYVDNGNYRGYAFTRWGAGRVAKRFLKRAAKDAAREPWVVEL